MKIEFTSPVSLMIEEQHYAISGFTKLSDGMYAIWLDDGSESIVVYVENNKFIIDHISGRADQIVGEKFLEAIIDFAPSQSVRMW